MQFNFSHNYGAVSDNPAERFEVKIQCYHARRYRHIPTGVFLETKYWDQSKNFVSAKCPAFRAVSVLLTDKMTELENRAYLHEKEIGVFDFAALKAQTTGEDTQLFSDFILSELKTETKLELKSIVKYRGNAETLKTAIPGLVLCEITEKHINALDVYFRSNFAKSTAVRLHIFTNKYLKIAVRKKLLKLNPYDAMKIDLSIGEIKRDCLTWAEVLALEALAGLPESFENARDRFLYSCFTGLRISDNMALLKTNLTDTADGYVVNLHTIKGYGHDLTHPLALMFNGKPDAIVRRWINRHQGDTVFPKLSDQRISDILKILQTMTTPPITINLTFHVARHTCATLLAEVSQDPFLLKNILGWSDIKTAMLYVHASPEATKRRLKLLSDNWKNIE